jgi:hypothetical protein
VLGFLINGYFKQWYGHALMGMFTLDLVGGLLITWLLAGFARHLHLQAFFTKAPANRDPATDGNQGQRWQTRRSLWSFSVLVGILSHIGFDLISHDTNLLLYPWYENIRWFPSWWYITWFEFRPLPMFGQSYAVGVFTILWGLLTLLGIFLFIRFVSPNSENRV